MPTMILMENAGRGAAAWIRDQRVPAQAKVLILCGPGNNGGDGGVVARHLDLWGYRVRVVWFAQADRLKGDAAVQFQILDRSGFDQTCWDDEPSSRSRAARCAPDRGRLGGRRPAGYRSDPAGRGDLAGGHRGDEPLGQADPRPRPPLGTRRRHVASRSAWPSTRRRPSPSSPPNSASPHPEPTPTPARSPSSTSASPARFCSRIR